MVKNIFFILLLMFSLNAHAQKDYIAINTLAIPPFSNRIDEILTTTNVTTFLFNKTSNPLTVKVFIIIKKEGIPIVKTNENWAMSNPISFLPNENKLINFKEFASLKESDITILPEAEKLGLSTNDLLRTRKLPEGSYEICIDIYDFSGADKDQWNTPNIGCARMELASYEVPQVIDVNGKSCGEKVLFTNPQFVSISWLKPAGFMGLLDYELDVVEVFPNNREVNDAIFTATKPMFLTEITNSTIFVINLIHQPLKEGARYVFRVRAIDPSGNSSFRNNGYSQTCSFVYGDVPQEVSVANISSVLVYPAFNDTIPFANPPMLIKFAPYFQNIEKLTCQYIIKENQQEIRQFSIELETPSGVLAFLKAKNDGMEFTDETATQIILGKYGESAANNLFQRGKEYSIYTKVDFKYKNNPVIQTVNNQSIFTYGLPAAQLSLLNNMPDTGNLNFQVSFLNAPQFPIGDFNNIRELNSTYQFDSMVYIKEKGFVEFSPNSNFDSVWYAKELPFNKSFNINDPATYLLTENIYANFNFNFRIKETGNWFMRLKWLKDTTVINRNPEGYYTSSSIKFTLGDSVDNSSTNCLAGDCNFPTVPMNERFSVDSLKVGAELKIGHHTLKVTTITKASEPFSGEGIIKINPFPGIGGVDIPVKVKFNDLKFKADFRVFQGTAMSVDGSGLLGNKSSTLISVFFTDSTEDKNNIKAFIQNAGNYVQNQANESVGMPMPIGFADNKYAGTTYKLAIASISFSAERALMNVILGVNNNALGNHFDFFAKDVCLRETGLSVSKIVLKAIGNREVSIGNAKKLVILGAKDLSETQSSIEWDCNGFKNMNLKGYIEIDSSVLKQEDASITNFVKAEFDINIKSWNDFVIDLSISNPFQIVGLPKWSFSAKTLTLDLSASKNPMDIDFPSGYMGIKSNEWQGVYFKNIEVKTPNGFKDKTKDTGRLMFSIHNLLIDRTGVSVHITNQNLLPLDKGRFDDWAISVDLIDIKVLSSAFQYGKIDGRLRVPIDTAKDFAYSMVIDFQSQGRYGSSMSYQTTVSNISQIDVPMWKAKFSVLPNSHAKFYYNSDDSAYAELKINGKLSIDAQLPKIGKVEFNGISVQDFIIRSSNSATTDSSFLSCGAISFASEQKKAGGFPVNFKDFKMVHKTENINGVSSMIIGLQINLDVDLKMGINTFNGSTRMNLWAKPTKKDGVTGYAYHDFEVDSIGVKGKISVLEIEGGLKFYDADPIYGNGLKGNLMAQFTPGIGLGALAYFGEVTQNNRKFDYWGVFGSVTLSTGIPILAAFEIAGFGGGVYNNMEMVLPAAPPMTREVNLNSSALIPTLVPKFDVFGFRATVFAQSFPGGTSWKAALSLGAEIKKTDFSVQIINFQGNMWMMTPPELPNQAPQASFWAGALLKYDFVKDQFDGNFTFYVNKTIMDGVSLKGIHAGDRAGTILLHYSEPKWFVYAGQPNDRCGIKLTSPNFTMKGYFVMGTQVPGIPELPEKIRNVLNTPISPTRSAEISQGNGFGFGAEFSLNTGEKKFLFMTASLDLLVGFDMSLMKYGQVSCDGLSTAQIGIDGWYARGQLYAYAEGIINADIDVWFYEGKVEIMNCKAGMVLEGGLPNPSWMKGSIAGSYRLFKGALKGPFKFDAQIGKECRPALLQESPVAEMKIIADVKPSNNANGYDIFEKPEVLCNFKLGSEIVIEVMDNNGVKKTRVFRPKLNIKIKEGNTVIGHYTNSIADDDIENIRIHLNNDAAYKPYQQYTLELTEFFEEKINNVWSIAKNKSNQNVSSVRNVVFNTGGVPATIPESIITEMTPAIRENFFMKKGWSESGQKVNNSFTARFSYNIKQYYLMDSVYSIGSNFLINKVKAKYIVRMTNINDLNEVIEQNIEVYAGGTTITSYQSGNLSALKPGATYKIEIVRKPTAIQFSFQSIALTNSYNAQYVNKMNNPNFKIELKQNSFKSEYKSNNKNTGEVILFTTYFNCSKFETMEDKVSNTKIVINLQKSNNSIGYNVKNSLDEHFDVREWNNSVWIKDIIQSGVNWYKTWDSAQTALTYLANYKTITYSLFNSSISWSANMSNTYEALNDANVKFMNFGGKMWNVEPINNLALIKQALNNTDFLALNRTTTGQNFTSSFETVLKQDRANMDNNIVALLTKNLEARQYLLSVGMNNPQTGQGKLMPTAVSSYLNKYLNGTLVSRKMDGLSYHNIWWYYARPSFNTLPKQINNYKINSIINR